MKNPVFGQKTVFDGHFEIFWKKLEVDFSDRSILQFTIIEPECLPLEFWKYLN